MEEVLDRKVAITRGGRYNKYLIKWSNLPYEDNNWISEEELKALDRRKWKDFEERSVQEDLHSFLRQGD